MKTRVGFRVVHRHHGDATLAWLCRLDDGSFVWTTYRSIATVYKVGSEAYLAAETMADRIQLGNTTVDVVRVVRHVRSEGS